MMRSAKTCSGSSLRGDVKRMLRVVTTRNTLVYDHWFIHTRIRTRPPLVETQDPPNFGNRPAQATVDPVRAHRSIFSTGPDPQSLRLPIQIEGGFRRGKQRTDNRVERRIARRVAFGRRLGIQQGSHSSRRRRQPRAARRTQAGNKRAAPLQHWQEWEPVACLVTPETAEGAGFAC